MEGEDDAVGVAAGAVVPAAAALRASAAATACTQRSHAASATARFQDTATGSTAAAAACNAASVAVELPPTLRLRLPKYPLMPVVRVAMEEPGHHRAEPGSIAITAPSAPATAVEAAARSKAARRRRALGAELSSSGELTQKPRASSHSSAASSPAS